MVSSAGGRVVMWSRLFDRACGYFGRPSSTSTGFGAWWFMLCSVFNNNAPFGSLLMLWFDLRILVVNCPFLRPLLTHCVLASLTWSVAFCIFNPPLVALFGSCIVGALLKVQQGSGTRGQSRLAGHAPSASRATLPNKTHPLYTSVLAQDETPSSLRHRQSRALLLESSARH